MNIKEEIKKFKELEKINNMWDEKLCETIETDKYTLEESEEIEKQFDKSYFEYWEQRKVIINIIIKYTNIEFKTANTMLSTKQDQVLYLLSNLK